MGERGICITARFRCSKQALRFQRPRLLGAIWVLLRLQQEALQRHSAFVGREGILATIRKKLEQAALDDHGRVALIGLGRVG